MIFDGHSTLHPKIAVISVYLSQRVSDAAFVTISEGSFAVLRFVIFRPLYWRKRGSDFCPAVTAPARIVLALSARAVIHSSSVIGRSLMM